MKELDGTTGIDKDRQTARPNTGFMIRRQSDRPRNMGGRFKARANRLRGICICLSLKLVAQYCFIFSTTSGLAITPAPSFQLDINLKRKIRSSLQTTERSSQEG